MKVIIADSSHMILCTIYNNSIRIPVAGDYVCFNRNRSAGKVYEEDIRQDGIVEKVMIDYIQDIAIVTVKET